jgi:hypothetical protein
MGGSPAPRFGRYEIVERIAIGGMAELYRARLGGAHDFAKPVVIKRILPHLSADPSFVSMFIDEAKITAQLSHPKIVQVFELGTTGGELFIAMEYVEGIDLLKLLRFYARRGRRLPPPIAVHIAHEILDALEHAHAALDDQGLPLSVVHRDVSPGNVLISSRGTVKLTDFGIARAAERNQKTEAGTLKGKYGYMSPEQVINADVDGRSDIFAVGVVFAEMLMGKRLFVAPSDLDVLLMVRDVNLERLERYGGHIDSSLLELVHRALASSVSDRVQTAGELRDELADWLFERRHRIAAKHIAQMVAEVRRGGTLGLDSPRGTPVAAASELEGESVAIPLEEEVLVEIDPSPKAPRYGGPLVGEIEPPATDVSISWRPPTPVKSIDELTDSAGDARLYDPGSFGLGDPSRPELEELTLDDPETGEIVDPGSTARLREFPSDRGRDPGSQPLLDPGSAGGDEPAAGSWLGDAGGIALREIDPSPKAHHDRGPLVGDAGSGARVTRPLSAATPAEERGRRKRTSSSPLGDAISQAARRVASARIPEPEPTPATTEPDAEPALAASPGVQFCEPRRLEALPERGELGHLSAIALFANLVRRRATGRLALVLEPTQKEIYFIDGMPKFVSSNVASERLGSWLERHHVISSGELSMALSVLPQFDNRLIAALVGLGLMDESRAVHCLTQQVRAKLVDACGWEKGNYRFYDGEEIPYPWLPLPLDPYEVMGAASLGTSIEFMDGWSQWREERIPQIVKPQPIPLDYFRVSAELRDVLANLDGHRTLGNIHAEFPNQQAWRRFCRLLFLLCEVGGVSMSM